MNELKLSKVWNRTSEVFGVSIATVMWDSKPWKVINKGMKFDEVTKSKQVRNKSKYYDIMVSERIYKPIKEFKYQTELASYILNKLTKQSLTKGGERV